MSFTDELEPTLDSIVTATVEHPMVAGLGDGTLDVEPFERWVRQDYYYLTEYNRVFALGAAKAPDLDRMGRFATLLSETLDTEMDLHRAYAAEFGIDAAELEATEPSPTTRGYTDFLVRTASHGTFGDLVAALLPCMWGFHETGLRLDSGGRPGGVVSGATRRRGGRRRPRDALAVRRPVRDVDAVRVPLLGRRLARRVLGRLSRTKPTSERRPHRPYGT